MTLSFYCLPFFFPINPSLHQLKMGNSASKTKTFSANLRNKINQAMPNHDGQQEPPSPHRTLVESDLSSTPSKMTKPSILQNHSFFNNVRKAKKKSTPIVHQHRQHTSVKNTTLSRKKPRFKKKVIITKSIIGKPTNFKVCAIKILLNNVRT